MKLVEDAEKGKAESETIIRRFAKIYTPLVVAMALLLAVIPPLVFPGDLFSKWVYRAFLLLVISCPRPRGKRSGLCDGSGGERSRS